LVLLDVNLLNNACEKPLYVSSDSKQKLLVTINRDTEILNSYKLMDYSLLLGIDKKKKELVLGIIDYIREFTWDKRMENVVKERYDKLGSRFCTLHVVQLFINFTKENILTYKTASAYPDLGAVYTYGFASDSSSDFMQIGWRYDFLSDKKIEHLHIQF
jgi:hypothetical protein